MPRTRAMPRSGRFGAVPGLWKTSLPEITPNPESQPSNNRKPEAIQGQPSNGVNSPCRTAHRPGRCPKARGPQRGWIRGR